MGRAWLWAGGVAVLGFVAWRGVRWLQRRDDAALWTVAASDAVDGCDVTPAGFVTTVQPPASLPAWTWASRTAAAFNIDNTPPPELWSNLHELAAAFAAIDAGYPVAVTSAYRSPALNSHPKIGGVRNSRHLVGRAMDLVPVDGDTLALKDHVDSLGVCNYTLMEYGPKGPWLHCEIQGDGRNP